MPPIEGTASPLTALQLGGLFCTEIGAGTLAALAVVPPAPVGAPFYRLVVPLAAVPLVLGPWLCHTAGGESPAVMILTAVALAAAALFAIRTKGKLRSAGLAAAVASSGAASALNTFAVVDGGTALRLLSAASAVASGLVVGLVGVAMTLGHAYLTYPNLKIEHLARLNRACVAAIVVKSVLVVATIAYFGSANEPLQRTLGSMGGTFGLLTRSAVGVVMPLVFAWMVASSIRHANTRSATGILYASTVLVLMGEAIAVSLRGQTHGVPL